MPKEGKIAVVTGTRPEIIKMAPIIRELHKKNLDYFFVHCGQHYDYNMSQQFIEDLELPSPDYNFKIQEGSPGNQMAQIIIQVDGLLKKEKPSIVLVACWPAAGADSCFWQPNANRSAKANRNVIFFITIII